MNLICNKRLYSQANIVDLIDGDTKRQCVNCDVKLLNGKLFKIIQNWFLAVEKNFDTNRRTALYSLTQKGVEDLKNLCQFPTVNIVEICKATIEIFNAYNETQFTRLADWIARHTCPGEGCRSEGVISLVGAYPELSHFFETFNQLSTRGDISPLLDKAFEDSPMCLIRHEKITALAFRWIHSRLCDMPSARDIRNCIFVQLEQNDKTSLTFSSKKYMSFFLKQIDIHHLGISSIQNLVSVLQTQCAEIKIMDLQQIVGARWDRSKSIKSFQSRPLEKENIELLTRHFTNLETLIIGYVPLALESLNLLKQLICLKKVMFAYVTTIRFLNKWNTIEDLEIQHCQGVINFSTLNASALKVLTIKNINKINSFQFTGFPRLETLSLEFQGNFDSHFLAQTSAIKNLNIRAHTSNLLPFCPSLKTINLDLSKQILLPIHLMSKGWEDFNGHINFKGDFDYNCHVVCKGQLQKGVLEGEGEWAYQGKKFVGIFEKGRLNGNGKEFETSNKYTGKETLIYEGQFLHGQYHGEGTKYHYSGSRYCGEFKRGVIEGKGTFTYGHHTLKGEFHEVPDNRFICRGERTLVTGSSTNGVFACSFTSEPFLI